MLNLLELESKLNNQLKKETSLKLLLFLIKKDGD